MRDRGAPAYWVTVRKAGEKSGEPLDLSSRVLSLSFEDHERKADKLQLTVDNFDLSNFDDPIWEHGNIIEFSFGYESAMAPVREAVIRKITGGQTLNIEAHSTDVIMDRVKRRESYENMTRSEVVAKIAARNGYALDNANIEDTKERFEIITQPNLTDAQMLRKLAHLEGKEFFVDFDGFHWHERDVEQAPIREFVFYTDPGQGDIKSFNVDNDITRKPGKVRVKARDPETKQDIEATEEDSEKALQPVRFLKFNGKDDGEIFSGYLPPVEQATTVVSNAQTKEEATTEAKKRFRKATQNAVKMTLVCVGDPNTLAKSVIQVSGLGARLSGKYYVQDVASSLSGGGDGYDMQLKVITDGFQRRGGSGKKGGAEVGTLVTALHDLVQAAQLVENDAVHSGVAAIVKIGEAVIANGATDRAQLLALFNRSRQLAVLIGRAAKEEAKTGTPVITGVMTALKNVAMVARGLASADEEQETDGKVNTKEVGDPGELTKVRKIQFIGGGDGEVISGYIDSPRGKK